MHRIQLRLGFHPRPRWGSSQRSPRLPSWILWVVLLRKKAKGQSREKRKKAESRNGKKGKEGTIERKRMQTAKGGEEGKTSQFTFLATPLRYHIVLCICADSGNCVSPGGRRCTRWNGLSRSRRKCKSSQLSPSRSLLHDVSTRTATLRNADINFYNCMNNVAY